MLLCSVLFVVYKRKVLLNDTGEVTHQINSSNSTNEDQVSLLVTETPKGDNNNAEHILDEEVNDLQETDP